MSTESRFECSFALEGISVFMAPAAVNAVGTDLDERGREAHGLLIGSLQQLGGKSVCVVNSCQQLPDAVDVPTQYAEAVHSRVKDGLSLPSTLRPVGIYRYTPDNLQSFCDIELPDLLPYFELPLAIAVIGLPQKQGGELIVASGPGPAVLRTPFTPLEASPARPERPPRPAVKPVIPNRPLPHRPTTATAPAVAPIPFVQHARPSLPVFPNAAPAPAGEQSSRKLAEPVEPKSDDPGKTETLRWYGGAALLVVLAGTLVWLQWPRPSEPAASPGAQKAPVSTQAPSTFNLRASRSGGDLEITWAADSVASALPESALLQIVEGPKRTEAFLDASHLRSGRILYTPTSGEVDIRLEILTRDQKVLAESLKVLQPGFVPSNVRPAPAPAGSGPGTTDVAVRRTAPSEPSEPQVPVSTVVSEPATVNVAKPRLVPTSREPVLRIEPLAIEQRTPSAPIGEPAVVTQSAAQLPDASPAEERRPAPAPPESPRQEPAEPLRTNTDRPVPVPLQQVRAEVPLQLRGRLTREILVEVHLTVGPDGTVQRTRVDNQDSVEKSQLANAAVQAARRWRFQPATRNGLPVPSSYTLIFRFKP